MSDSWINARNYERLRNAVGDTVADDIIDDGYTSLLAKIESDGTINYFVLNSDGHKVRGLPWLIN